MSPPTTWRPAPARVSAVALPIPLPGAGEHGDPAGEVVALRCVASSIAPEESAGVSRRDYADAGPVACTFPVHARAHRRQLQHPLGCHRADSPSTSSAPCLRSDADVLVIQEAWRPHGRASFVDEIVERHAARSCTSWCSCPTDNPARPRHLAPAPGPAGTCGLAVLSRLPVAGSFDIVLPHARAT